ncbi:macro domain-containing protein [Oceanobacillus sp. CAU 1775]
MSFPSFSRFDENNRAYLSMQDYISCLLKFWNEIDIIYRIVQLLSYYLVLALPVFEDMKVFRNKNY